MNHLPSHWPQNLCTYLLTHYGMLTGLESQGGQSQASVWLIEFQQTSLIVKKASVREGFFYTKIAQPLRLQGISIPHLIWQEDIEEWSWLVIEHIPYQLPRNRWAADPAVLQCLYNLHQCKVDVDLEINSFYQPQWTEMMNEQVVKIFESQQDRWLIDTLSSLSNNSQHLFHPQHWISGDPNPTNWGVHQNNEVVLYDWERFCRGTAALDLAINMPGLPDRDSFRQAATIYSEYQPVPLKSTETQIASLTEDIILAKIWSFVEFITLYQTAETKITPESIAWLVEGLPTWLAKITDG